jgi:hypothetical protein
MPATYEPIATTSPTGSGQVTFSSIPSTYTDIALILSLNPSGTDNMAIRFNNDSASNYSLTRLIGNGSSASSTSVTNSTYPIVQSGLYASGYPAFFKFDIFGYAGSTNKTFLSSALVDKNGSGEITNCVGLWRSTSAINRIDLFGSFGNGTTVTIYGIKAA